MEDMIEETKTLLEALKSDPEQHAYIWVHCPRFFINKAHLRIESEEQNFRLCRVWWNDATKRMCWAVLSCQELNQRCFVPSWLRQNLTCVDINRLKTEKEESYSNDPLNSDDFTEQAFTETLLWFPAKFPNESKIVYPPDNASTCAQIILSTLIQLREILKTLGKPDLEIISAGIRNETFASAMLAKLQEIEKEKTFLEVKGLEKWTSEEIGGTKLMRRDFYYFSKAFLDDVTAKKKMESWRDNARLICPCILKKGRVDQVKCCIASENRLGLEKDNQSEDSSWRSLWHQEVKPAELNDNGARIVQEERMTFCWCSREFKTAQERDLATSSQPNR
jgi:hypothetical protein